VSLSYRLGIALAAMMMALLPLIYLGLVGLVCYGIYYHAFNHFGILAIFGPKRWQLVSLTFLVYVTPLVVGGILILFMLKPFFARPAKQMRTRKLKRAEEPLLFAFVAQVCDAVGAPRPRRIVVNCAVNAAASFRRGLGSMFGHDLVLTIGAPLVAGLNLRQFAGVLAHEFGHFSQRAGMRLTYVVRSISFWLKRVMYERDEWDQWLIDGSQDESIRLTLIMYLARFFVWVTRRILWCLMIVGHAFSAYLLRQMELDADRYETRLAGSDTFASTTRRLVVLQLAHQTALADLGRFYREGRLADNFPQLLLTKVDQLTAEGLHVVEEVVDQSETGWFDTHPCDRDRIASARRENAPGVFRMDPPATTLFRNFPETARAVTEDFYRTLFGPTFRCQALLPSQELLSRQGQEIETYQTLSRYFQNTFSAWRTAPLSRWTLEPPAEPKQALASLRATREKLLADLSKYQKAYQEFEKADTWMLQVEQGGALLDAKVRASKSDFPTPLTSWPRVSKLQRAAAACLKQVEPALAAFETTAAGRLLTALDFLMVPGVAKRLADSAAQRQECARLFNALAVLEGQVGALVQIRNTLAVLSILLEKWEAHPDNLALDREIHSLIPSLERKIGTLRHVLLATPYPFDHGTVGISLGVYALPEMPSVEDLDGLLKAGNGLVDTLPRLRARILGRLCQMAEAVETVLGLEPLPKPSQEEVPRRS
jgi:Zn-dependent protease with chaperone function